MENKIFDFFQDFYKTKYDNFSINYKENHTIYSLTISDAIQKFKKDFCELKTLLPCSENHDKIFFATCNLWKKHLVKFE